MRRSLVCFPEHALLIVEERLREQQAEGVRMPEGMPLDELTLRILIVAETGRIPSPQPFATGYGETPDDRSHMSHRLTTRIPTPS